MKDALLIVPIGNVDPELVEWLSAELAKSFQLDCFARAPLDPAGAFHPERKQYLSSDLLAMLASYASDRHSKVLGITRVDLYLPVLTFVFGEAELGGRCALVSYHRLRQEFYGLPEDRDVLASRLLVEAVHELGHTLHLTHCHDYQCAMSSSHSVEWIDLKDPAFCEGCASKVRNRFAHAL